MDAGKIEAGQRNVLGKTCRTLAQCGTFFHGLERAAPRGALAVVDLPEVQDLTLDGSIASRTALQ